MKKNNALKEFFKELIKDETLNQDKVDKATKKTTKKNITDLLIFLVLVTVIGVWASYFFQFKPSSFQSDFSDFNSFYKHRAYIKTILLVITSTNLYYSIVKESPFYLLNASFIKKTRQRKIAFLCILKKGIEDFST